MASMYRDFAETPESEKNKGGMPICSITSDEVGHDDTCAILPSSSLRSNAAENFPVKLHYMLGELKRDGLEHIVSWQPHGRCFIVHNQKEFEQKILPLYV
jgi:HSF-type DNA-binding